MRRLQKASAEDREELEEELLKLSRKGSREDVTVALIWAKETAVRTAVKPKKKTEGKEEQGKRQKEHKKETADQNQGSRPAPAKSKSRILLIAAAIVVLVVLWKLFSGLSVRRSRLRKTTAPAAKQWDLKLLQRQRKVKRIALEKRRRQKRRKRHIRRRLLRKAARNGRRQRHLQRLRQKQSRRRPHRHLPEHRRKRRHKHLRRHRRKRPRRHRHKRLRRRLRRHRPRHQPRRPRRRRHKHLRRHRPRRRPQRFQDLRSYGRNHKNRSFSFSGVNRRTDIERRVKDEKENVGSSIGSGSGAAAHVRDRLCGSVAGNRRSMVVSA